MIERLIEWGLNKRFLVITLFLAAAVFGYVSMNRLSIDAVPDITNVSVMVNTKTGALAPEEIERNITFPIETELSGLPLVDDIRSLSKYGLSQVIVVFKDSMDVNFARQLVSERLQNIKGSLPEGVNPELGPLSTGLGDVFMYTLLPKKGSPLAAQDEKERLLYLRTVQDLVIKPFLKSVPGVAEVESNGGYKKQIHINVDPRKMDEFGLNCNQLAENVRSLGENFGGGYIQIKGEQLIVRTMGKVNNLDMIRSIPVKLNVYGKPVRLGEVATISEGHELRLGAATYNGNEAVLGTVLMRIGENSRNVSQAIEKAVNEIKLPDDVVIKTLYTRSHLVNDTIFTVAENLVIGGILVVMVLFFVLGNMRAAFLVALAIPLSMLFAFIGMVETKISASLMSLGAVDFGLIVDGSVVIIENIMRRFQEKNMDGRRLAFSQRLTIVKEACLEVGRPTVMGVLIIMIVYVPVLLLSGIEGKMFRPMALTVLFALAGSLLIAMFLMPVLSTYILRPSAGAHDRGLVNRLEKIYRPVLNYSLHNRKKIIPATLMAAFITGIMFFNLGSDFIPKLDEGDMVVGLVRDTGIAIDQSVEMQRKSDRVIARFGEVETVFSRMGTPESATDPMGVNFADTFVILKKDRSLWPETDSGRRTKEKLFSDISRKLEKYVPGQEISMTQPIEMRFNEILEGSRADITLRLYGNDLDRLLAMSLQARKILLKIEGAETVEMDPLTALKKSPVLNIRLDYERISEYGVRIQDVNHAFQVAMNGLEVGYLYDADRRFPIMVRLDDRFKQDLEDLSKIPIGFPDGGTVPLSKVTTMIKSDEVTTIARSRGKRYSAVSINLRDRDTESFVGEAKEKIHKAVHFPGGYYAEWGGQFKNLESARRTLYVIIPVILLVIFIILARNFHSLRQTLLVFNSIPFAVTGGIFFIFLRGIPLSVSAGIGFIAVTGIAILDGMVLVTFFNQLREQGKGVITAVLEGSLIRLRPVVMTSLVAGLGFIPMAFNTGPGAEVQRPLATVVIGGILSSTLLTLLLLPTLYAWFEGGDE